MRKKLIEEVVEELAREGYTVLSDSYIDSHTKIPFICSKGHEHSITWGNWSKGQRCIYCSSRPRITRDTVRESFLSEGLIIPEDWEYVNSRTKIPFICTQNHKWSVTWNNWSKGSRCFLCANPRQRLSSEDVRAKFAKEGYVIPEDWEYVNCKTKIPYVCSDGNKHSMTLTSWNQGKRRDLR